MRKKDLEAQVYELKNTVRSLTMDSQVFDLRIDEANKSIQKLRNILVEAGILETEWTPEAPKGSSITPNGDRWAAPTYTKINKVWE